MQTFGLSRRGVAACSIAAADGIPPRRVTIGWYRGPVRSRGPLPPSATRRRNTRARKFAFPDPGGRRKGSETFRLIVRPEFVGAARRPDQAEQRLSAHKPVTFDRRVCRPAIGKCCAVCADIQTAR